MSKNGRFLPGGSLGKLSKLLPGVHFRACEAFLRPLVMKKVTKVQAERAARNMASKKHMNSKYDGICPWCNISKCSKNCDLGVIRRFLGIKI